MTRILFLLVLVCINAVQGQDSLAQSLKQQRYTGVAHPIHRIPMHFPPPRYIQRLDPVASTTPAASETSAPPASDDDVPTGHRQFNLQRSGYAGSNYRNYQDTRPYPQPHPVTDSNVVTEEIATSAPVQLRTTSAPFMPVHNLPPRPMPKLLPTEPLEEPMSSSTTASPVSPSYTSRHFYLPRPIPRPIPRPMPVVVPTTTTEIPASEAVEPRADEASAVPEINNESPVPSTELPTIVESTPAVETTIVEISSTPETIIIQESSTPEPIAITEEPEKIESTSLLPQFRSTFDPSSYRPAEEIVDITPHPAPSPPTTASPVLELANSSPQNSRPLLPPRPIPRPIFVRPIPTTPPPMVRTTMPSVTIVEPQEVPSVAPISETSSPPQVTTMIPVTKRPALVQDSSTLPSIESQSTSELPSKKPMGSVPMYRPVYSYPVQSTPRSIMTSAPPRYPFPSPKATTQKPKPIESRFRSVANIVDMTCDLGDKFYAVEDECEAYIECKKNVASKYLCPDGLYFNPEAKWSEYPCAYPSEVQCVGKIQHPPRSSGLCPRQFGFFPSESDCSKYLMCQEGLAVEMSCPAGLAFNPSMSSCDWPANVPSCNPNVFQGFTCPPAPLDDDDGSISDVIVNYKYGNSCKEYVACHRGKPRLLSCDGDYSFDADLGYCAPSDLVQCGV